MKKMLIGGLVVLASAAVWVMAQQQQQAQPLPAPTVDRVGFPEGYQNWKVMFVVDRPDNKQVRVIYGNEAALQSKPGLFPYGSVLVMEVYRAKVDDKGNAILDANGRYQRGDLTAVNVQRKERGFGVEYGPNRSGEWEYMSYRPDKTAANPPSATGNCALCHLAQGGEQIDFVFRADMFFRKASGAIPTGLIQQYTFVPGDIRVKAGSTVTWYNDDEIFHTVKGQNFDSGNMPRGASFSYTFKEAGAFEYICGLHPAMKAKVIVE